MLPFAVGLCAGYAVFSIAALHREAATREVVAEAARAAAAAERAAKAARAARLARAKAAREEAERRLATRTNDSHAKHAKREDSKNTQTPVGELSREALLERARGALPRRANAAGDTGIPGGA